VPFTHEQVDRFFFAELCRLSPEQKAAFGRAIALIREGLASGSFHPQLAVRGFRKQRGMYEVRWESDGRALVCYSDPLPGREGPHIIWLRIGTHGTYID
jgi:hypothetical protein